MKNNFKVGDKVICLPGFDNSHGNWVDSTSGGGGYEDGKTFIISSISDYDDVHDSVAWPESGPGVFIQALALASGSHYEIY